MIRKLREPINGLTHFIAALAAIVGTVVLLIIGRGSLPREISLSTYGLSLTLLFGASAAYHLANPGPRGVAILRQLDHSAIYILIAGTYTRFCILALTGFWRWGLFTIIWSLALIGIVVKLFIMRAPRWITAGTYIVMGWLCIGAVGQMLQVLPVGALVWLTAGGVIYTLGAVIYITRILDFFPGRFGFHEVWHIFVILGAAAHFVAIAAYVAAPHIGG
jgi:hemolysin III